MNTSQQIPKFDQPRLDDLFLASSFGLHTYEDLRLFEKFFIQYLFDFGHDFSKPVGFLASSSDTLVFAIGACWNLNIPILPLDHHETAERLNNQIDAIEPGLIFAEKKYQYKLNHKDTINIEQLDIAQTLAADIEPGYKAKQYKPGSRPEDVFGYFFTSGTTGKPKVVPLKRRQMLFAAQASANNFKPRPNHFWLLCLPINHVSGISIILRSLLYGSGIFRMNSFHHGMINTFLSENKLFQVASLVPTMLRRLIEKPGFSVHSNFKAILLGGGPVNHELIRESIHKGIPIVSSYGMTETCAQIAANPLLKPSGTYLPMKSVGKIFSANKIEIRDEDDRAVRPKESGQIWIKGPQVFDGYLNRNNTSYFDNGWFNTGDFGHLNTNGLLFIEDRRDDLIITGGENVSPTEVEEALQKNTKISEAAVIGLPDKEWGQRVAAVVVPKLHEPIDKQQIIQELKQVLTRYKIPKQIIQADTLPKTRTGKVRRRDLIKLFEVY